MTHPINNDHHQHLDAEVRTEITPADLFAIQAAQLATDLAELERLGFIGGEDW